MPGSKGESCFMGLNSPSRRGLSVAFEVPTLVNGFYWFGGFLTLSNNTGLTRLWHSGGGWGAGAGREKPALSREALWNGISPGPTTLSKVNHSSDTLYFQERKFGDFPLKLHRGMWCCCCPPPTSMGSKERDPSLGLRTWAWFPGCLLEPWTGDARNSWGSVSPSAMWGEDSPPCPLPGLPGSAHQTSLWETLGRAWKVEETIQWTNQNYGHKWEISVHKLQNDTFLAFLTSQVVLVVKKPSANAVDARDTGFDPWVGKIPWRRKWHPTPGFLPEESHGQRSLAGYSPWGHKELDTIEHLSIA